MTARRRRRVQQAPPKSRARKRKSKGRSWLVVAGLVAGPVGALLGALLVWGVASGPGQGRPVFVTLPEQARAGDVARELAGARLVASPRLMQAYLTLLGAAVELEPGEHLLNDALSPRALVQRLARLPGRPAARVAIPEGWNHVQIADRLEKLQVCSAASFRRAALAQRAEGYLFPATYELSVDSDPAAVITTLMREATKRLERLGAAHPGAWDRLRRAHGWGEREVLTLASMVERETASPDERPKIASVFFNRLSDPSFVPPKMLQSDPTAAYGCLIEPARAPSCARYSGRVTPEMLRDDANRYNTYRHPGLPPGPIANPGESSIAAVLSPAQTPYLFFVANGGGRHIFSRTFDEHNAAIERSRRK